MSVCVDKVWGPESIVTFGLRQSREKVQHPDWLVKKQKLSLSLLVLARRLCSLLPKGSRLKSLWDGWWGHLQSWWLCGREERHQWSPQAPSSILLCIAFDMPWCLCVFVTVDYENALIMRSPKVRWHVCTHVPNWNNVLLLCHEANTADPSSHYLLKVVWLSVHIWHIKIQVWTWVKSGMQRRKGPRYAQNAELGFGGTGTLLKTGPGKTERNDKWDHYQKSTRL